jgi:hypothetical protein
MVIYRLKNLVIISKMRNYIPPIFVSYATANHKNSDVYRNKNIRRYLFRTFFFSTSLDSEKIK